MVCYWVIFFCWFCFLSFKLVTVLKFLAILIIYSHLRVNTKKLIISLSLWMGLIVCKLLCRIIWINIIWKLRCHYLYSLWTHQTFHRWTSQFPLKVWVLGTMVLYSHEKRIKVGKGPSIQFACVQLIPIFSVWYSHPQLWTVSSQSKDCTLSRE